MVNRVGKKAAVSYLALFALILAILFIILLVSPSGKKKNLYGNAVMNAQGIPRFAFCEHPVIAINQQERYKTVSCNAWQDVSAALAKLDGNYVILKRDNALVYSLSANGTELLRIIGNGFGNNSCLNLEPDFRGDGKYVAVAGECTGTGTLLDYKFEFVHTNPEIEEFFGYDQHVKLEKVYLSTHDLMAIDGIFDERILRISHGNEQNFPIDLVSPPFLEEEYQDTFRNVKYSSSNEEICEGCLVNGNICVAAGYEWKDSYCEGDDMVRKKKEKGASCSAGYECSGGICTGNACGSKNIQESVKDTTKSIFDFFLRWFRR